MDGQRSEISFLRPHRRPRPGGAVTSVAPELQSSRLTNAEHTPALSMSTSVAEVLSSFNTTVSEF